ncbi:OPT oligopeptide transporter protein-domain-containing protein [Halenospora varia]|nr:OPT oligopeptide transporter protein-domain-containing protein [Halenospora varia]
MGSESPVFDASKEDHFGEIAVLSDAKDVLTHILHVDDDPSLSPWTIRAFFLGIGLAVFASVLQEIYYFKPQAIYISIVFMTVVGYALGELLALIPRKGRFLTLLNPFPFNSKEHGFIIIMASAAATNAVSTEILAAQRLYYNADPNAGAAIFLVISSQLLGFGIAGLLRSVLVQPSRMLWPINIPVVTLLETLHRDKAETRFRLKVFWIVFAVILVWEIIPEWIFPLLQGLSIFCLAKQNSLLFTNLFGGSQGNEGLGFLSISFDWQYIASLGSPMWIPLYTLTNSCIGYLLCIVLFMGVYYGNIWESQHFPFMSQLLFDDASNSTVFSEYNLSLILTPQNEINRTGLAEHGIPHLTGTYLAYLITTNMGCTAALVHMFLWNWSDIKAGFFFLHPTNLKKLLQPSTYMFWKGGLSKEEHKRRVLEDPTMDPHYKMMVQEGYEEVPNWWYGNVLVLSFIVGLGTLYGINSTLPWWGYIIANLFAAVFILFFGAQMGLTGFQFNQQPIIQMVAGYIHPGKPLANMYFTVFGFNGVQQGQWLARDLKVAQLVHLSPKATFTAQILGAVIGAIFNYIMMKTIVTNQFTILKSIEGSNIWSGQNVQQYNTLAIAWSIAGDMFSVGARYQWVTISYLLGFIVPVPFWLLYRKTKIEFFNYINLSIILWYMGWLFVGVNASILSYFVIGFFAQYYLRLYRPGLFVKYNYLVSAALDGGTQVLVFIFSFAVFGGSGKAHNFPTWAGNNGGFSADKNIDFCMYNPANG